MITPQLYPDHKADALDEMHSKIMELFHKLRTEKNDGKEKTLLYNIKIGDENVPVFSDIYVDISGKELTDIIVAAKLHVIESKYRIRDRTKDVSPFAPQPKKPAIGLGGPYSAEDAG